MIAKALQIIGLAALVLVIGAAVMLYNQYGQSEAADTMAPTRPTVTATPGKSFDMIIKAVTPTSKPPATSLSIGDSKVTGCKTPGTRKVEVAIESRLKLTQSSQSQVYEVTPAKGNAAVLYELPGPNAPLPNRLTAGGKMQVVLLDIHSSSRDFCGPYLRMVIELEKTQSLGIPPDMAGGYVLVLPAGFIQTFKLAVGDYWHFDK